MIRIKICCIQSVEEARLAIRHGVNLLGLVSEMPSGPGVIPEERITQIAANVPPGVTATLLTSQTNAASIIEQQRRTGVQAIQLVDRVSLTA
ncbi:phosphoribosylanthranilate isomerase, partial [bacterium]|nr:phosphoribosylanthranilate isomerase [bacterium]